MSILTGLLIFVAAGDSVCSRYALEAPANLTKMIYWTDRATLETMLRVELPKRLAWVGDVYLRENTIVVVRKDKSKSSDQAAFEEADALFQIEKITEAPYGGNSVAVEDPNPDIEDITAKYIKPVDLGEVWAGTQKTDKMEAYWFDKVDNKITRISDKSFNDIVTGGLSDQLRIAALTGQRSLIFAPAIGGGGAGASSAFVTRETLTSWQNLVQASASGNADISKYDSILSKYVVERYPKSFDNYMKMYGDQVDKQEVLRKLLKDIDRISDKVGIFGSGDLAEKFLVPVRTSTTSAPVVGSESPSHTNHEVVYVPDIDAVFSKIVEVVQSYPTVSIKTSSIVDKPQYKCFWTVPVLEPRTDNYVVTWTLFCEVTTMNGNRLRLSIGTHILRKPATATDFVEVTPIDGGTSNAPSAVPILKKITDALKK